jgi:hypothetical protein
MTKEERNQLKINAMGKVAANHNFDKSLNGFNLLMMQYHDKPRLQLGFYSQVIDEILNEVEKSRSEAEG